MKIFSVVFGLIGLVAFFILNERNQKPISLYSAVGDGSDSVLCLSKSDLREWGVDTIYDVNQYQVRGGGISYNQWQVDIFSFGDKGVSFYTASYDLDSNIVFHLDSLENASSGMSATFSNNFNEEGELSSSGGMGYGSFDWNDYFWVNDTMAVVETTCSGHCGGNLDLKYSIHQYNSAGLLKYKVYISKEISGEEDDHFFEDYATFRKELDSLREDEVDYDTTFYNYGKSICEAWHVSELPDRRSEEYYSKFQYHQIFIGRDPIESFILEKTGVLPRVIFMQVHTSESYSFVFNENAGKYF